MKKIAFLSFTLATLTFTTFGHLANQHSTQHAQAQEAKQAGDVRFPTVPVEVLPMPKPNIVAVSTLAVDQLYVIDADIPILLFDSPRGMVKVAKEAGPLRIRGRFVDGKGVETRHFKGKQIYLIEAAKTGPVELIIVPVGATDQKEALRKTLDVDAGEGPRPPPIPPGPTPGPTPLGDAFRVMILYETAKTLPAKQASIIAGKEVRDYLDSKCVPTADGGKRGYYIVDKDADFSRESKIWQDAIQRRPASVPWAIISSPTNGTYEGPLPADVPAMMTLLRKYGG